MPLARWFRPPLRTLTVFVALVVVLGSALAWLGWQVIQGDRIAERARAQERLDAAADRVTAAVQQRLADLDRLAAAAEAVVTARPNAPALPEGVLVLRASPQSVAVAPQGRLLFVPDTTAVAPLVDPLASRFAEGEKAEHVDNRLDAAIGIYQMLARSPQAEVRAGALVRLARTQRHAGRPDAALATYDELARLDRTPVFGLPALLQAGEGRGTVLEALGRTDELSREADRLATALSSGNYPIDRASWEFRMQETRRWGANRPPSANEAGALVISDAVDWAVRQWTAAPDSSGRRAHTFANRSALVIWAGTADHLDAAVAGPGYLQAMWTQAMTAGPASQGALLDETGKPVAGQTDTGTPIAIARQVAVPGLPWTIRLARADATAEASLFAGRRRLLLYGFLLLGAVLVAGSFFIIRSIARERAVARLQSEFVSAVSHEFRTPLTALRQLSELLARGRVPTDEQRQQAYDMLSRESERLQHLVESLLDFGRVRAGAFTYRFERADAAALAAEVVEAFRDTAATSGFTIALDAPAGTAPVRADREALGLALRNLLDNAVKYSPDCRTVWVNTSVSDGRVHISVRDEGVGIPAAEQRVVFDEFVRGAASREAGVKGTGIGLALARQIVFAHHGEIRVDSAPGAGSTFTILLPLEPA